MTVANATVCSTRYCVDGEKRVLMYAYLNDTAAETNTIT